MTIDGPIVMLAGVFAVFIGWWIKSDSLTPYWIPPYWIPRASLVIATASALTVGLNVHTLYELVAKVDSSGVASASIGVGLYICAIGAVCTVWSVYLQFRYLPHNNPDPTIQNTF
jgi:hypothetical protein